MIFTRQGKLYTLLPILLIIALSMPFSALSAVNGNGQEGSAGNNGNKDNLDAGGQGWGVYMADKRGTIIIPPKDIYFDNSGPLKPGPGKIFWVGSTKLSHENNVSLKNGYTCADGIKLPKPGSSHDALQFF